MMNKPQPEPMPEGVIGYAHATLSYTPALLNDARSIQLIGLEVRALLLEGKAVYVKQEQLRAPAEIETDGRE